MASFGASSLKTLSTCDERIQRLFNEVVKGWDCTIICGHRGEADQTRLYLEGKSKLQFPASKHNSSPSLGVDVAPYYEVAPHIRWNDDKGFRTFAGYVMGVANSLGIPIRWGGDWDGDHDFSDQTFNDLVHFEIKG
jgi:peptidoglycan L-alanyl-D-glutamate endopeptidase CwlK